MGCYLPITRRGRTSKFFFAWSLAIMIITCLGPLKPVVGGGGSGVIFTINR